MKQLFDRLTRMLASRRFFYAVLIFFVFEALWIAFSSVYPMAFDEDFHFGLIKIYAQHWSPFLTSQPAGGDAFGAVARDPSYLYHYLMSFPYRILAHFVHGQSQQVIVLRVMNVAMFTGALALFRRVLLRVTSSPALTNVSLGVFILIPIVPQLAAHINYDNLLMIMVAWTCLLVFRMVDEFAKRVVNLNTLGTLAVVCMLTSLVKYAFLPIFAAVGLFALFAAAHSFASFREFGTSIVAGWRAISTWTRVLLIGLFLLSFGLFFQRYGINTLRYHNPIPDCNQVLSEQHCSSYGPWERNYSDAQNKGDFDDSALVYTAQWFYGLWWRLFFAINGPDSGYVNYPPEPLPAAIAIVVVVVSVIVAGVYYRRIFTKHPLMLFFLLMIVLYCGALWRDDYKQYLDTGEAVAVNGRYLLPILLPAAAIFGRAISLALRSRATWIKPAMATVVLLLFLQGGGVFTFILRSDSSWDWSSTPVIKVNDTARKIIKPFVIQTSRYD